MNPSINRVVDFAERVGWTAVYFAAGAFIAWATSGDPWSWRTFGIGVGLSICKVVVAQNVGKADDGALPSPINPPPESEDKLGP
jgi:hypothetical protein